MFEPEITQGFLLDFKTLVRADNNIKSAFCQEMVDKNAEMLLNTPSKLVSLENQGETMEEHEYGMRIERTNEALILYLTKNDSDTDTWMAFTSCILRDLMETVEMWCRTLDLSKDRERLVLEVVELWDTMCSGINQGNGD